MGDQIFVPNKLSGLSATFYLIIFVLIFGSSFYFLGKYIYDNKKLIDSFEDMLNNIKYIKR
jgi:hypothetical protein